MANNNEKEILENMETSSENEEMTEKKGMRYFIDRHGDGMWVKEEDYYDIKQHDLELKRIEQDDEFEIVRGVIKRRNERRTERRKKREDKYYTSVKMTMRNKDGTVTEITDKRRKSFCEIHPTVCSINKRVKTVGKKVTRR